MTVNVIVFWVGESKSGNSYIGVNKTFKGLAGKQSYFLRVIDETNYEIGQVLTEVPEDLLVE